MIEFAWPWVLVALPLPWLARRLLRPVSRLASAAQGVTATMEPQMSPSVGVLNFIVCRAPSVGWAEESPARYLCNEALHTPLQ